MKINIINKQIYLHTNKKMLTYNYKQNKNKLRTKHSERRYHEQHRTFR